jgi:hypothetical protein
MVTYFENSAEGVIVGKTTEGLYIVQADDGELDILDRIRLSVIIDNKNK